LYTTVGEARRDTDLAALTEKLRVKDRRVHRAPAATRRRGHGDRRPAPRQPSAPWV